MTIKFSDRPEKRIGDDAVWDKAEAALMAALKASGRPWTLNKGEGAFYGPKLEYVLRDAIGRDWQCGTVQVDLNMPGRLGAFYIDEHSNKVTPVMLHRAMFGSLERFTGIMIEHYAGHLPLWLSPVQAVIATITSDADDYAREAIGSGAQSGPARVEPTCATRRSITRCASTRSPKSPHCWWSAKRRRPSAWSRCAASARTSRTSWRSTPRLPRSRRKRWRRM